MLNLAGDINLYPLQQNNSDEIENNNPEVERLEMI